MAAENPYGQECIIDVHNTLGSFSRKKIRNFLWDLCDLLGMEKCDLHFFDYEGDQEAYNKAPPHLKGISAVQFITTSNITIHTLDEMNRVYLNIFSCKKVDANRVRHFVENWTGGKIVNFLSITRI